MKQPAKKLFDSNICGVRLGVCLLLAAICVVGYWPVSLDIFSLKNDATMYFLPYRYHISNAIQNGEFPFWSPYLYLGFPIHADMQSGAWNPVVWTISLFTRYNMSVLHAESLLYVFIAGIGMYKLLGEFLIKENIRLAVAVCYMFSGFMTDSGEFIVWLASAAFIPFVVLYYYRLITTPSFIHAFKAALAMYMLLVAGYPSFLIYCAYVLLAASVFMSIHLLREKASMHFWRLILYQGIFAGLFLLFSLPALWSYLELLPFYSRGSAITLNKAMMHPFPLKCALSFITPFNLSREDIGFGTDGTMRNTYIGLFSLPFLMLALTGKMKPATRFSLFIVVLTFLFTLGDATPVRALAYRFVPLMNYFRHPANMRIFTSLGLLFIAAHGMQMYADAGEALQKKMKRMLLITAAMVVAVMLFFLPKQHWGDVHLPSALPKNFRNELKELLYRISFPAAILITGTIQLVFLAFFPFKKRYSIHQLLVAAIINAVVIAQLSLPATFVSLISPKSIDRFIAGFPSGFPIDELRSPVAADNSQDSLFNPIAFGYSNYYNKKIEIPRSVTTPCMLSTMESFLNSPQKKSISEHPVFYLAGDTAANNIAITQFGANRFDLACQTLKQTRLHVTQNYYMHWKAFVDGRPVRIAISEISFMSIELPAGAHNVRFEYAPDTIYIAMIIAAAAILACLAIFIHQSTKNKRAQTRN